MNQPVWSCHHSYTSACFLHHFTLSECHKTHSTFKTMIDQEARRAQLLHRARAFCAAFGSSKPPSPQKILDEHFRPEEPSSAPALPWPRITEHGPEFARDRLPFLGRTFHGRDECLEYFRLLGEVLKLGGDGASFPAKDEGYAIDVHAMSDDFLWGRQEGREGVGWANKGVVSVVGHAIFTSVKTDRSWEETFTYRLSGFDEDGNVGHWEIWADPLSAWCAVGGEDVDLSR